MHYTCTPKQKQNHHIFDIRHTPKAIHSIHPSIHTYISMYAHTYKYANKYANIRNTYIYSFIEAYITRITVITCTTYKHTYLNTPPIRSSIHTHRTDAHIPRMYTPHIHTYIHNHILIHINF